jgi:actin-related protein
MPNNSNQPDILIGEELSSARRNAYRLCRPLSRGLIQEWDDMEALWKHAFALLKTTPSECAVLLTEPLLNPLPHRRRMLEVFFEKFQVPAVYVGLQGVLSLYFFLHSVLRLESPPVSSWTQEKASVR